MTDKAEIWAKRLERYVRHDKEANCSFVALPFDEAEKIIACLRGDPDCQP